jgi:hypothetical protein
MTAIEKAINEAVEKGEYENLRDKMHHLATPPYEKALQAVIFLDPSFWQALGKARGWDEHLTSKLLPTWYGRPEWQYHWRRFIDHLAEGKDAESFFATL